MSKALSPLLQFSVYTFGCLCANTEISLAQVTSDNTEVNTQVNQNGNVAEITGGQTRGENLFHSFQDFSVPTGNEAFFNNESNISNIFSRVTGGNVSNIDGLIRANGSASLFLINPAGIIFGEGARLDIGGSFLGSTATSVLFEDGEFSAADLENPPLLTVNAPIGLGFRDNPGDIVNRSVDQNPNGETNVTGGAVGLQVSGGASLALVGGNVLLDDGNLTAKGGHIEIGSVLSEGEVRISQTDIGSVLDYSSINSFGNITLQNTAVVDATSDGGGSIYVVAKDLSLDNSAIRTGINSDSSSIDIHAGNIIINATNSVEIINDGNIQNVVNPRAIGNAGNIKITTGSLALSNFAQINSSSSGTGNSGNIVVESQSLTDLIDSSAIITEVSDVGGVGDAGGINIKTDSLLLRNGSALLADTENQGNAGNILIEAGDTITLEGKGLSIPDRNEMVSSQITARVESDASGEAGNINVFSKLLSVTDEGFISTVTFGDGSAGNINISTGSFVLDNDAGLFASTEGTGDGGDIFIKADESIAQSFSSSIFSNVSSQGMGNGGNVEIQTKTLSLTEGSQIGAAVFRAEDDIPGGTGNGGNVKINATDSIDIAGVDPKFGFPSGIVVLTEQGASGEAGNIDVRTGSLRVADGAAITVGTRNPSNGGSTVITSNTLEATEGGQIRATTRDSGNAGNITLNVAEKITLSGSDPGFFDRREQFGINRVSEAGPTSGIFVNASETSTGQAGSLQITTGELEIQDQAKIDVSSLGDGSAGDLNIIAKSIDLNDQGSISASTPSDTGGNISFEITDNLIMRDNSLISSRATGEAIGGNIDIDANFVIAFPSKAPNNGNDIIANAIAGKGGNINITSEQILGLAERKAIQVNGTNDIDASSEFGLDGNVSIFTPDVSLTERIAELPTNTVESEQTTAQACQVNRETIANGSLIINGKGGIPLAPDLPLDSHNIAVNGQISNPTSAIPKPIETSQGKIQPARGIKVTVSGDVILTAYRTNNLGNKPNGMASQRLPEIKPNCGV